MRSGCVKGRGGGMRSGCVKGRGGGMRSGCVKGGVVVGGQAVLRAGVGV